MQNETPLALSTPAADAAMISSPGAAVIPLAHHEKFYALKEEERARVSLLLRLFDEIGSAPEGVVAACRRLSLEHPARGFSWGSLKNNYYAWLNSGRDWRAIARLHGARPNRPAAFDEEVRRRIEANKRGARQAIFSLYSDWAAGASIPGYGTWRQWYLDEFPERDVPEKWPLGLYPCGWGKSQLYKLQSSRAERALARRGFAAAKRYLPHIIRDRSALRPLELVVIDDFETDIVVQAWNTALKRHEICTCTGLLAIDAATGRKLAVGLKPRFKSDDGRRIAITRADVQQLLYSVFSEHGLPAEYGVTILCENAAAAITPEFELALETLLGVQVARTGLLHAKTLKNGFVEKGGKPYEKGWVESAFNLVHNMGGALPGQKGANYTLKPGDHEAKVLFAEKLLSIEGLNPEQLAQLRVPFLPFAEALAGYEAIFAAMDRRTTHRMQGFLEVFVYQLPDHSECLSQEALALRNLSREELLACTPVAMRESPLDRWARLGARLTFARPPEAVLMLLLLAPRKVTLAKHRLTFEHAGQGYTFSDADSPVLSLPEGTELLCYFDPAAAHVLHCCMLDGRYIGPVKRRGPVAIGDAKAIGEEQAEIMRVITKHVIEPVRARHAAENARLAEDDAHNLALLRQWQVPASAIPSRLLPPAVPALPASPAPARAPHGLSAKLARQAPARDAFTAHREALARGIAGHEVQRAAVKAIDQAEVITERAKAAVERAAHTSAEESWL